MCLVMCVQIVADLDGFARTVGGLDRAWDLHVDAWSVCAGIRCGSRTAIVIRVHVCAEDRRWWGDP